MENSCSPTGGRVFYLPTSCPFFSRLYCGLELQEHHEDLPYDNSRTQQGSSSSCSIFPRHPSRFLGHPTSFTITFFPGLPLPALPGFGGGVSDQAIEDAKNTGLGGTSKELFEAAQPRIDAVHYKNRWRRLQKIMRTAFMCRRARTSMLISTRRSSSSEGRHRSIVEHDQESKKINTSCVSVSIRTRSGAPEIHLLKNPPLGEQTHGRPVSW